MTAQPALREAVTLIRRGQWAAAEPILVRLVADFPREPDALRLLGIVRASQQRPAEAEALLRRALALRPEPEAQVHLARILAATGRTADAIPLLEAAAGARPDFFDAFFVLAQVQAKAGDFAGAEKNFRAALALAPQSAEALGGLGAVLNELGRPAEGETLLRRAKAAGGSPSLRARTEHNLGVALERQGRYEEALAAFDEAAALQPGPVTLHNRAKTLAHLGRDAEAIAAFRTVIARAPLHREAHRELNALLYRLGRDDEFLVSYDAAAQAAPRDPLPHLERGQFLLRAGRAAEARESFARAASLAPDDPGAQAGLAEALAELGECDAAIAAYEKALARAPDDIAVRIGLAGTLLQADEAKRALRLSEAVVGAAPFDQAALAVHELALRANHDGRAARLADYERHVRIFDLEPPEGFASMADFNQALNAYLDTLHTDAREHIDQTLRRGTQTREPLFGGGNDLVRLLRGRIEQAVARYIAEMADGEDHPLSGRRRAGFAFSGSWSSRLADCGFHTNHIHPRGWISSCYYVAVPDAVADETAKEGWIKFGEPSFAVPLAAPVRRAIRPAPGRLVLFPSYMWHGTIPFHAATARTTIAFDAIPV